MSWDIDRLTVNDSFIVTSEGNNSSLTLCFIKTTQVLLQREHLHGMRSAAVGIMGHCDAQRPIMWFQVVSISIESDIDPVECAE